MIRVGMVGAGWVTEHHLDGWSTLTDRASVVAIADPDEAAARARASRYGIPATFPSLEAMLAAVELDAVDIAAPREHHVPLALRAADAGVAILCQKPLAPTHEEAVALVEAVGDRVPFMVHENWRFRPHYRTVGAWVRNGRIGQVRTASMRILTSGFVPDADGQLPALVRQPMMAGLERMLLMEVLIHHVDTLRFLVGPLTLEGARLGRSTPQLKGEDRATLLLTGRDRAAVTLVGDFVARGHPVAQVDRLEIFGTDGAIRLDGPRLQLFGAREEDVTLDLAANYKASYRGAIAHFVDRLADGGPFETAPADNLETLKIVEEAYRMGGTE